jgi:hypothetical protein
LICLWSSSEPAFALRNSVEIPYLKSGWNDPLGGTELILFEY